MNIDDSIMLQPGIKELGKKMRGGAPTDPVVLAPTKMGDAAASAAATGGKKTRRRRRSMFGF